MAELPTFPTAPGWEWLVNRQGRLTPEQIKRVRTADMTTQMFFVFMPVTVLMAPSSSLDALEQSFERKLPALVHGAAIAAITAMWIEMCLALIILLRLDVRIFRVLFESRQGRVAQVEGTLRWRGRHLVAEAGKERLKIPSAIGTPLLPGPYRFHYLHKSRVVAAAEWIGEPVRYSEVISRVLPAAGFPVSALRLNREGRRSPDQIEGIVGRTLWPMLFNIALFFIVLSAPLFTKGTLDIYFYMAQPVVFALVWFTFTDFRRFTDMRSGQVASLDGPVRRAEGENEKGDWVYSYVANGRTFRVSKPAYDALDERYIYRLYYTVRGSHLLNMEPIGEAADTRQGTP
jgi:hypothetical protein